MEAVINLDVAVREISQRVQGWRGRGFEVGPVTWRDQGDGWPPALKTDRAAVKDADSIGVRLRRGHQEGEVVLFKGGWCDVVYWTGSTNDDPVEEAPGYPADMTIEGFGAVLDDLVNRFR